MSSEGAERAARRIAEFTKHFGIFNELWHRNVAAIIREETGTQKPPAPQPEPTHDPNDATYEFFEPAPPAGAREAIMQALDPVSQWDAGYEAGKVVGAASERARADAAERDAKDAKLAYGKLFNENCAHLGDIDELRRNAVTLSARVRGKTAEVESLRSELREAREQAGRMNRQWNSALKGEDDALRKCRKLDAQVRDMREALRAALDTLSSDPKPGWRKWREAVDTGEALLSRKEDKAQ